MKIVLSFLLSLISIVVLGQGTYIPQGIGNPNAIVNVGGAISFKDGAVNARFNDTSEANLKLIKNYIGAQIVVNNQLWIRDLTATKWMLSTGTATLPNVSVGTGFPLVLAGTSKIKSLVEGAGISLDTTTTFNSIRISQDTSLIATKYFAKKNYVQDVYRRGDSTFKFKDSVEIFVSKALDWRKTGNLATTSTDFIGTLDNMSLRFRVNNKPYGFLDANLATANVGLGDSILASLTSGAFNSAFGNNVLRDNTSGSQNTGMGGAALKNNITGNFNTAIGTLALTSNTGGLNNVAIGGSALRNSLSGNYNVAVGARAGINATGSENIFIGQGGGEGVIAGANNTIIGENAWLTNNTYYTTSIGHGSGGNAVGDSSVFIGSDAGKNSTGSQKLYVANTSTSSPLIYGQFRVPYVSINGGATVDTVSAVLSINGNKGVLFPRMNTATAWAIGGGKTLSNIAIGTVIYNVDSAQLCIKISGVDSIWAKFGLSLPGGGGGSGTLTNLVTGYGTLGGPITNTGTITFDSATVFPQVPKFGIRDNTATANRYFNNKSFGFTVDSSGDIQLNAKNTAIVGKYTTLRLTPNNFLLNRITAGTLVAVRNTDDSSIQIIGQGASNLLSSSINIDPRYIQFLRNGSPASIVKFALKVDNVTFDVNRAAFFDSDSLKFGKINMVDSIRRDKATTSVYYYIGGIKTFAFIDSIGGGVSSAVTSVATGFGLSGGTITTTGTVLVDSTGLHAKFLYLRDSVNAITGYVTNYRLSKVIGDSLASHAFTLGHYTNPTGFDSLFMIVNPTHIIFYRLLGISPVVITQRSDTTLTFSMPSFAPVSGKTLTLDNSLELAGTDGTVMQFPTTSATLARTDAVAQTFLGDVTMSGFNTISNLKSNSSTSSSNIAWQSSGGISNTNDSKFQFGGVAGSNFRLLVSGFAAGGLTANYAYGTLVISQQSFTTAASGTAQWGANLVVSAPTALNGGSRLHVLANAVFIDKPIFSVAPADSIYTVYIRGTVQILDTAWGKTMATSQNDRTLATTAFVKAAIAAGGGAGADAAQQTLTGLTFPGAGTAPSGTATNTYRWSYSSPKHVVARFNINYSAGGATVGQVNIPLPPDMPDPEEPNGFTTGTDYMYIGDAYLSTTKNAANADRGRAYLTIDSGGTTYTIIVKVITAISGGGSGVYGWVDIDYWIP